MRVILSLAVISSLIGCSGDGDNLLDPPSYDPTQIDFSGRDYLRSTYLDQIKAYAAYNKDITGYGRVIAIIDSGIDKTHPDFRERIHAGSYNLVRNSDDVQDEDGHGTAVAGLAAGRHNNQAIQGVAPDAKLLIYAAMSPNGLFYSHVVADGVRRATASKADVINLSLGGGSLTSEERTALIGAADGGVVVVAAVGNDYGADPINPAALAGHEDMNGLMLAVTSVDSNNAISSFANNCAVTDPKYCLAAPGEDVAIARLGGYTTTGSGTSFAAPLVSGAVALLKQHFPNLTGAQTVEILISTATDAGAAGVDNIYGSGILNIERAMQPIGNTTTKQGQQGSALNQSHLALSSAFGTQSLTKGKSTLGYDKFDRAYNIPFDNLITNSTWQSGVAAFLQHGRTARRQQVNLNDGLSAHFSASSPDLDYIYQQDRHQLPGFRAQAQLSFSLSQQLKSGTSYHFRYGQTPDMLAPGNNLLAQALALTPLGRLGNHTAYPDQDPLTLAAHFDLDGRNSLLLDAFTGSNNGGAVGGARAALRHQLSGNFQLYGGAEFLAEKDGLLGAARQGAFDGDASTTAGLFAGFEWQKQGWAIFGHYHHGFTQAADSQLLSGFNNLQHNMALIGVSKYNAFAANDRLALTIGQPLRVLSGSANLHGQHKDDDGNLHQESTRLSLAPRGKQINIEIGYQRALDPHTKIGLSTAWIHNPGHNASKSGQPVAGLWLRKNF